MTLRNVNRPPAPAGFPVFAVLVLTVLGAVLTACGGSHGATPEERGRGYYLRSCAMCHGHEGGGRASMGNALKDNEFVDSLTDEALVEFIKEGRPPNHPLSKTRRIMPPKGGDPRLTDEQLLEIVAFLRTL